MPKSVHIPLFNTQNFLTLQAQKCVQKLWIGSRPPPHPSLRKNSITNPLFSLDGFHKLSSSLGILSQALKPCSATTVTTVSPDTGQRQNGHRFHLLGKNLAPLSRSHRAIHGWSEFDHLSTSGPIGLVSATQLAMSHL